MLALIQTFPLATLVVNKEFLILDANERALNFFELELEDLQLKSIGSFFSSFEKHNYKQDFEDVYINFHGIAKRVNLRFELYEDGVVNGLIYIKEVVSKEINLAYSERKSTFLIEKLNLFEIFLNQFDEGVLVFDKHGKLLYGNTTALEKFEISSKIFRNALVWELFDFFGTKSNWEAKKQALLKSKIDFLIYTNDKKSNETSVLSFIMNHRVVNSTDYYMLVYHDITESKRDKMVIDEKESQIKIFHKSIPAAIFQFEVENNLESYISYMSDSFKEIFGFEMAVYDKNWPANIHVHPEDLPLFYQAMKVSVCDFVDFNFVGRYILENNSIIWFEVTASPTKTGNKIIYNGIILDITTRKEVEFEIKKKREFNDSVLSNIPADVVVFDENHNYMFINSKGIANEELRNWMIGKNDFDYCHYKGIDTHLAQERRNYFNKAKETKQQVDWIDEINRNGDKVYVLRRFYPFYVEDKFVYMIGYGVDISELRKTQILLTDTQKQSEVILKSAFDGIVLIDKEWKINYWNPKAEEIFGWEESEIINQYLPHILFPNDQDTRINVGIYINRVTNNLEQNKVLEVEASNKTGKQFPIELTIVPIQDESKEYYYCAFIRDISSRKNRELEIDRQNKILISQNKELEQFTYIASHDLQEPLLSLISYSKLLAEEYESQLDEEGKLFVNFIQKSATRMRSLISGLMQYARINQKEEFIKSNIETLLYEVLDDLKLIIKNNEAIIKIEELPTIACSPTFIRLLFQNLISNAIKFSKKEIQSIVTVSCEERQLDWMFKIQDNGIGIETKNREQIFLIFKRLHNQQEYDGHGIGLAHCKKIVEIHDGEIWVESKLGQGSTFYFTISKTI